jgi:uncharacterized protein involved in cysteine biosynthesis
MKFGATKFTEIIVIPKQTLASIHEVLKTPRLILSIIPQYIVGLASGFIIYKIVIASLEPTLIELITFDLTNWPLWISSSINWVFSKIASGLSILVAGFSSILGAYLAILVLAGFFVELFIDQALKIRNLKILHPPSFFGGVIRLVKDESIKTLLLLTVAFIAFICAFFPLLAPLSFVLTSLLIGFELFDQPLALRGYKFSTRLKVLSSHIMVLVIFGGLFSLTAVIPFLPILLLPFALLTTLRISLDWALPDIEIKNN